jgi:hypothetical protein
MSMAPVSGLTPSYTTELGGAGGTDNSQLQQFIELLLEELQQLLSQMNGGSGDGGSGSGGSPAGGIGGGAPSPSLPAVGSTSDTPSPSLLAVGSTSGTPSPSSPAVGSTSGTPSPSSPAVGSTSGTTPLPSSGGDMTPSQVASTYKDQIAAASQATGIPPGILAGQIWQESKGIASTPGGGLMQLGPNEFQEYGGGDISNPADNIMAGAQYMKALDSQFGGNIEAALRAYNSGPNGVDLNNLNSTPAGTGDPTYVQKVMEAAQQSGLATT